MPRFYFDIFEDGRLTTDNEGLELRSPDDARREARRALMEILADLMRTRDRVDIRIEIRDSEGGACIAAIASSSITDAD